MLRVLGIESSCDETGLAIFCAEQGLLAHALSSQVAMHQPYGGVVPELASRDHLKQLIPLLENVLDVAQLSLADIDAIAYTAGPGLIGALLTGACFAKSLAFALSIPSIAVHHLEAHLLAAQLDTPSLCFPFLGLLVSGGHTQLLIAHGLGNYELLGDTLDDAVGEAFDKTAKTMGLAYPGGALLAALADETSTVQLSPFPRPMTNRPGLDFSFSGLKTHAREIWLKSAQDHAAQVAIARAFQEAVVATLVCKCERAVIAHHAEHLVVAGGVGANRALRQGLENMIASHQGQVFFPRPEFCTDNGAMVAYAGCLKFLSGKKDSDLGIRVHARWPLESKFNF